MNDVIAVIGILLLFFGLIGALAASANAISPVSAIGAVGMAAGGGALCIIIAIEENGQKNREFYEKGIRAIIKHLGSK